MMAALVDSDQGLLLSMTSLEAIKAERGTKSAEGCIMRPRASDTQRVVFSAPPILSFPMAVIPSPTVLSHCAVI